MFSDLEKYKIIDLLNELIEPLNSIDAVVFACFTIATLQPITATLPTVREAQIKQLLTDIDSIESVNQSNTIGNKSRLIKADVLEWSDRTGLTNQNELMTLRASKLKQLRVFLGLRSIEALLKDLGATVSRNSSMVGNLYRS